MRILFIEDDAMNRRVVKDMLLVVGLSMDEAEEAETGLARLASEAFDLVLMDIRMPGTDGLTATSRLRAAGHANANVPVIVVTADVSADVHQRARDAGADGVVLKPVALNELIAVVGKYGGQVDAASVTLD
jgi:CheY-like chemotaxis protein